MDINVTSVCQYNAFRLLNKILEWKAEMLKFNRFRSRIVTKRLLGIIMFLNSLLFSFVNNIAIYICLCGKWAQVFIIFLVRLYRNVSHLYSNLTIL